MLQNIMRNIKGHPFDLDTAQIDINLILEKTQKPMHPDVAKLLASVNPDHYLETTLEDLCLAIKKRLPPGAMTNRQWEDFINQFDENDLKSKKNFNDLLQMLQRESFYRDTLAEVNIYKQSSVRLRYATQMKFLSQAQLKVKSDAQNDGLKPFDQDKVDSTQVQPSFSYLITDLMLFHFQGTQMLVMTNEHGDCQLYDAESGVLQHQFVFNQAFNTQKSNNQKGGPDKHQPHQPTTTSALVTSADTSPMLALGKDKINVVDQETVMTTIDSDSKASSPIRSQLSKKTTVGQAKSREAKLKGFKSQKSRFSIKTQVFDNLKDSSLEHGSVINMTFDGNKTDVIIEETDHEDNTARSKRHGSKKNDFSTTAADLNKVGGAPTNMNRSRSSYPGVSVNNQLKAAKEVLPSREKSSRAISQFKPLQKSETFRIGMVKKQRMQQADSQGRNNSSMLSKTTENITLPRHFTARTAGATARNKIKQYDEQSQKLISDHIQQQKVTQKLGLDYHIFEEEPSRWELKTKRIHQTTKNSETTSPTKNNRKDMGGDMGMNQKDYNLIATLDAYKARKEPIPFGMSEKIWDLDSYRQNFQRFTECIGKYKKVYEDNEHRIRELRGEVPHHANDSHNRTLGRGGNRMIKQDSQSNLSNSQRVSAMQKSKQSGQSADTRPRKLSVMTGSSMRIPRKKESSQEGRGSSMRVFSDMPETQYASQQINKRDKWDAAYIPVKDRKSSQRKVNMTPNRRFLHEVKLLHQHPDALDEIRAGIRADQQVIAQTLQNDQLLARVLEKQRDRNNKWLQAFIDEERKDPKIQRLPSIECIDFEHYEETYEEKMKNRYDYMNFYQTRDETIGNIIKKSLKKKDEDSREATRKAGQKTVKPSRPMFMTYYKKLHLLVFALLGEIKIIQIKQNGQKKTFTEQASHQLDHLPVGLTVGMQKSTNKLLIFVACQHFSGQKLTKDKSGKQEKCEIQVLQVNTEDNYQVTHLTTIHPNPDYPQISKIMYKKNYGLILACYRGYIERFNSQFESESKWDNDMRAIGSDKIKAKVALYQKNKQKAKEFDDFIADELVKRDVVREKSGPLKDKAASDSQKSLSRKEKEKQEAIAKKAELREKTFKALEKKSKEKKQAATINCLDYSADLYLIAFGTVYGQIGVLDSTTMSFIGMFDAHAKSEVSAIYFYKRERQMISVSLEGECALWDAQKMNILKVIRKQDWLKTKLSMSCFSEQTGHLLLATSEVHRYTLEEDEQVKIQTDQQLTVAANYVSQVRANLEKRKILPKIDKEEDSSTLSKPTTKPEPEKKLSDTRFKIKKSMSGRETGVRPKMVDPMQIVSDILNYKKLPQMESKKHKAINSFDKGSYTTLPSSKTKLIGCFINAKQGRIFTVDIDCLIRQWDLVSGYCVRSYPIEKPTLAGDQSAMEDNLMLFKQRHQIQTVELCPDFRVLAVAFMGGTVQLNNIYSGGILYNKAAENMIDLGPQEISKLAFFQKQTNFWVAATQWDARVAFLQRPLKAKGGEIIREKKVQCKHTRDVICIDITDNNHMATASIDNTIVFWNTYNAKEGKIIELPADLMRKKTIQALRFATRDSNDFIFVIASNGDIFVLETQSETFVEPADFDNPDANKIISQYSHGKMPNFALIDVKQKRNESGIAGADQLYMLGVAETGSESGRLFVVTITDPKPVNYGAPSSTYNKRMMHKKVFDIELANTFPIAATPQVSSSQATVIKVELLIDEGLFLISQSNGVISFYSIRACHRVAVLNQSFWKPLFNVKETFSLKKDETDSEEKAYRTAADSNGGNSSSHLAISDDDEDEQAVAIEKRGERKRPEVITSNAEESDFNPGDLGILSPISAANGLQSQTVPQTAKNATHQGEVITERMGRNAQQFTATQRIGSEKKVNEHLNEGTMRTKNSTQAQTSALVSDQR